MGLFSGWFVGMPLPTNIIALLIHVLFSGAVFAPVWRILARAGLNPVWSILLFVLPVAPPLILAYAFWPAIDGQKFIPRIFD